MSVPFLSVVSPVYGCAKVLPELCQRLHGACESLTSDYEIIFVNDASPDGAWTVISELAACDQRIKGIDLTRNFGQHYAITAGLDFASGQWVVVIDCDLQDQPEEIPKLYYKAQEGFDVVFARRSQRRDSGLKRLSSKLFYCVFDYLTEQQSDPAVANFGIFSNAVITNVRSMRESVRSFPLFVRWLGFPSTAIDVDHAPRFAGKSSYTFSKLFQLAMNTIVAQSNLPLRLSIRFGFLMAFSSLSLGAWHVLRYLLYGVPVAGWTSVIVSIWLLGGLMFMNIGFLGLYIGRIYNETKGRPLYVVREWKNLNPSRELNG